ncbi:GIY-YIG nuclease family protein [Candidatus Uhrbacteria bacterium]|nr:GIY-YIG nuclease family protein [Candidatus Uhrbacteria bacterium]
MFYTYVLKCSDWDFYIGSTENLKRRVYEHKIGNVDSTKHCLPIELVYYEACYSKSSAQKRERYFKTGFGRAYLKSRQSE